MLIGLASAYFFKNKKREVEKMKETVILTDSCSDLGKDLREKYGIEYVKMNTVIDGNETPADLDWPAVSPREFYDVMRNGKRIYTTQVPPEEFERAFEKYASEGKDVVYIACSERLSSSVNTGAVVARKIMEKYPDVKIYCVNSRNSSQSEGLIAIDAAKMRDAGLSAEEIKNKVEAGLNEYNMFCTVHSLDALKRAGRVKASAAFFGNLFGVKPIIISDENGDNVPIKKVKGRENSLSELVNLMKEAIIDPEAQTVYVAHADCEDEAKTVCENIKKNIPCKDVHIGYIGPIIGASIGPGAIAVFCKGKDVAKED